VTPHGLVDDTGTMRSADVLILSTGFEAARYLATLDVQRTNGCSLQEYWDGEPTAFLGLTVPGFPNLFMMYGPNTNGGYSVITQLEIQAGAITRAVRRLRRGGCAELDTRKWVADRVDRWVQQQISVHMDSESAGCNNYYHSASGKNVTQWPRSHTVYRALVRLAPALALVRRHRNAVSQNRGPEASRSLKMEESEP
jgi:hypothetical protein